MPASHVVSSARPAWRAYVALLRPQYHVSYMVVVLGSLQAAHQFTRTLSADLILLYVTFNLLTYGGLYTLNAVTDMELDRLHARKRDRPIASGVISRNAAVRLALLLLASGLASSYWLFSDAVGDICLAAALLNLVYSWFGRSIAYLEIVLNAATYPLRFALGNVIGGVAPNFLLLFLVFTVAASVAALRRQSELENGGAAARPVLKRYSSLGLLVVEAACGLAIALASWLDTSTPDLYYLLTAAGYTVLVVIPHLHSPSLRVWHRIWSV